MQLMSLSRAPPSRSRNWRSGPPSRCMPTKECTKQMVKMKVPLSTPTTTCQAIPSTINHSISCSMSIRGDGSCSIHALVPPCVHAARGGHTSWVRAKPAAQGGPRPPLWGGGKVSRLALVLDNVQHGGGGDEDAHLHTIHRGEHDSLGSTPYEPQVTLQCYQRLTTVALATTMMSHASLSVR